MKTVYLSAAALVAALSTTQAHATQVVRSVQVADHGFEAPALRDGDYHLGSTAFWSTGGDSGGAGVQNPAEGTLTSAPEGQNTAFLNSYRLNGDVVTGSIFQRFDELIVADTRYQLSVDVARRKDYPSFGRWLAEITAGEDVVAIATMGEGEVALGGFSALAFDYLGDADHAGRQLGVRFRSFYDQAQGDALRQVNLDNVRMSATSEIAAAVPEPATWAMMVLGFGLVGVAARRRARSGVVYA